MKAISLWQPWASAIATGAKLFETRSWPPPEKLIGERIAIHAAKRSPASDICSAEGTWPVDVLVSCGIPLSVLQDEEEDAPWSHLSYGAIICTAQLIWFERTEIVSPAALDRRGVTEKHENGHVFGCTERELGNYEPGRWAWRFNEVQILPEPVPFRGMQGIFEIPDHPVSLPLAPLPLGGLFDGEAA